MTNKLRAMLGVLLLLGSQHTWAEQQIQAGWVETLLKGGETLRNYSGGVAYSDSTTQVSIASDSVHVSVQKEVYAFVKGVSYRDSVRFIQADTLIYNQREGRAEFRGRVVLKDRDRLLAGGWIAYDTQLQHLKAKGDVHLDLPQNQQSLQTGLLLYDLQADSGQAINGVDFVLTNNDMDTLLAKADSASFSAKESQITFWGAVHIQQKGMVAEAGFGGFTDSLLVLNHDPHVLWLAEGNQDSIFGKADRISFQLQNRRIKKIDFVGDVDIRMVVADSQRNEKVVWADSATLVFHENVLGSLVATGQVKTEMTGDGKGDVILTGQTLELVFVDEKPDSLIITGDTEGSYLSHGGTSKSYIKGQQQMLWFQNQQVVRMLVLNQAQCQHIPEQGEKIMVSGDRLLLSFDQGDVQHIDAQGAVRGAYQPNKEHTP